MGNVLKQGRELTNSTGHFRVHVCFLFKESLSGKFYFVLIHMESRTNYHHIKFRTKIRFEEEAELKRKGKGKELYLSV